MTDRFVDIIRSRARPLQPIPTGVSPALGRLTGIRAVLWDIYGTLVISGSGDVGTTAEAGRAAAIRGTWAALRLAPPAAPDRVARVLEETIREHHAAARARGIEFPEVEIVEIWREVLERLPSDDLKLTKTEGIDAERLAVEYEARVNPVWPMPGMVKCLVELHAAGLLLGVVSNAQSYTPLVFPAVTGQTLEELGIDQGVCFFSYRLGHAKPGRRLFDEAVAALAARHIPPAEVLYVGNDILKDILSAARVGFRTGLFAGDARSLRLRAGDERVAGVTPDLVLTELEQVVECVCGTVGQ